jgi:hypothetical protein
VRGSALALGLVLGIAACSGDAAVDDAPRPITREEANVLSRVLVANHDAGTAAIVVNATTDGGEAFAIEGAYDWSRHLGVATLTTGGSASDIEWSLTDVATRSSGEDWVVRPAAPDQFPDLLLGLVTALSATQAENPLLLLQRDDVTFVRADELRAQAVDVYAIGGQRYWIGADDGALTRVETPLGSTGSAVVDLTDVGSANVPAPEAVVPNSG